MVRLFMKGTLVENNQIQTFELDQLNQLINQTILTKGTQYPNPAVGAMVIDGARIISDGYHQLAGQDHAEVIALKKAGHLAKGATLLITLEPCTVTGKTPACTDMIIRSGIARVIWAINDPNPKITNTAKDILSFHGIDVFDNVLPERGLECIKEFNAFQHLCRPYVYLKAAVSNDQMLAPDRNGLIYISSKQSLDKVQQLRQYCQAICVGVDTINIDLPRLSIRSKPIDQQPIIVVLDPKGLINREWLNTTLDNGRKVFLFTIGDQIDIQHNCLTCFTDLSTNKILNWTYILATLYQHHVHAVLVEGGGGVFQSIIQAKTLDEVWLFNVPKKLASDTSVPFCGVDQLNLLALHEELLDGDKLTIYKHTDAFSI